MWSCEEEGRQRSTRERETGKHSVRRLEILSFAAMEVAAGKVGQAEGVSRWTRDCRTDSRRTTSLLNVIGKAGDVQSGHMPSRCLPVEL